MSILGTVLAVVAAMYAVLAVLLYLFQDRLLFLPHLPGRELTATPRAIELAFDDVTLTAADGVRLHGWWVPAPQARFTLVHFHGNAGNIGHRLELLSIFHALPANVLMLDYRGYGRSEGRPTEAGVQRDAEAAWVYLTTVRGLAPSSIVVHGQSLGAAVAAHLAARQAPAGLIVESGFTSVPDMAAELYPWLPVRWLTLLRFETRREIANVRCPILVIHSTGDEIIPYAHGQRLFEAAPGPKRLLTIDGDHNAGFWLSRTAYVTGIREFVATLPAPG